MTNESGSRRRSTLILRLGLALATIGLIGLLLTGLGHWTSLGVYRTATPRAWEKYNPSLSQETRGLLALSTRAQERLAYRSTSPSEVDKMAVLYDLVAERFTHGDRTRHTLWGNWILWSMARIHPKFGPIRKPDILLRRGHAALCSEVSHTLVSLAEMEGVQARLMYLNGHVVAEAYYDESWHMYDADFEVVAPGKDGSIMSVAQLESSPETVRMVYLEHAGPELVEEIVSFFVTTEDNRVTILSARLELLESIAEVFKFIIPVGALLLGLGLIARRKPPLKEQTASG